MDIKACAVALVSVLAGAVCAAAQESPPASPASAAAPQENLFDQVPVMAAPPRNIAPVSVPSMEAAQEAPSAPAPAAPKEAPVSASAAEAPKGAPAAPPVSAPAAETPKEAPAAPPVSAPAAEAPKEAPAAPPVSAPAAEAPKGAPAAPPVSAPAAEAPKGAPAAPLVSAPAAEAPKGAPVAATPAAPPAPAPAAKAPKEGAAASSRAPAPAAQALSGRTIVKFKNGSIMPCSIVRETATEITVESEGVQFPLIREEIEYYGDAAKCPGMAPAEVVAEGKPESVDIFKPAVNVMAPTGTAAAPAAAPPAQHTPTREERFRAYQRKRTPGPSAAPPRTPAGVSITAINEDPSRFQGQKLVFHQVKLGVLQAHPGFYGLEILPPEAKKGGTHRGGSSPDLTMHGVTFVVTEAQAKDIREHSKQYDRARVECTVEPKVIGNNRYWVAAVTRLDVFRGDGNDIAWTMW